MTVFVDELMKWRPTKIRCFRSGSCHLTDTLEELHAFAARLGLKRAWFQDHRIAPHYDLTASKRERALELGAVFVAGKAQARARLAARGAS